MSPIVEVIVGLIFIFLLFSLLVTQTNSIIATLTRMRARHLRKGLQEIIQDPTFQARLFTDPLVGLVQHPYLMPGHEMNFQDAEHIANAQVTKVERLDPATFVNVFTNLVRVDKDQELYLALLNIVDEMPESEVVQHLYEHIDKIVETGSGQRELKAYVAKIEDDVYRGKLQRTISEIEAEVGQLGLESKSIIPIVAGIRRIQDPFFRQTLESILATSQNLVEMERSIGNWYDCGMERAQDAFKNNMQWISVGVSLVIAILLNVDTVQIGKALWEDPTLRAAINQAVQTTDFDELQLLYEEAIENIEGTATAAGVVDDETLALFNEAAANLSAATATYNTILELNLPMGWRYVDPNAPENANLDREVLMSDSGNLWNFLPGNNPDFLALLFFKLLGLGATTIALAQGAPFWFGILDRVVPNRR